MRIDSLSQYVMMNDNFASPFYDLHTKEFRLNVYAVDDAFNLKSIANYDDTSYEYDLELLTLNRGRVISDLYGRCELIYPLSDNANDFNISTQLITNKKYFIVNRNLKKKIGV